MILHELGAFFSLMAPFFVVMGFVAAWCGLMVVVAELSVRADVKRGDRR